jgi:hypothetical protein
MLWLGVMEIQGKYKIKNKIWFEADMYYSKAFRSLSKSAILTLMRCLQKRKWDDAKGRGRKKPQYKNDGFTFPYTEAAGLMIAGTTQHWKNLNKLVEVGFLDMIHQGGWYQNKENDKDFSVYVYSDRWREYGTPNFTLGKFKKKKVLPAGFHIRENMARQKLKVTSQKRSGQLHECEGERGKSEESRLHESEVDKTDNEIPESLANIA